MARMVEAQDARLSQAEAESAEKGREARRHQGELQAKLDAAKDMCEGACTVHKLCLFPNHNFSVCICQSAHPRLDH